MSPHLPECPSPSEYGGGEFGIYDERLCFCPALRACEQRVRDEQRARDYVSLWARVMLEDSKYRYALMRAALVVRGRLTDADVLRLTGTVISLPDGLTKVTRKSKYEKGYAAALDAARDAVAACIHGPGGYHPATALAAIDALRGES